MLILSESAIECSRSARVRSSLSNLVCLRHLLDVVTKQMIASAQLNNSWKAKIRLSQPLAAGVDIFLNKNLGLCCLISELNLGSHDGCHRCSTMASTFASRVEGSIVQILRIISRSNDVRSWILEFQTSISGSYVALSIDGQLELVRSRSWIS